MTIHSEQLIQTAVYWAPASKNKFGEEVAATPVDIEVRWVDTEEEIVVDGDTVLSNAKVFVGTAVALGGVLMLGTVAVDVVGGKDPLAHTRAFPVRKTRGIPNYTGDTTLRVVYL